MHDDEERVDIGGTTINLNKRDQGVPPQSTYTPSYNQESEGLLDRIGLDRINRRLIFAIIGIFGLIIVYIVITWIGRAPADTDPMNRYVIPTAQPTTAMGSTSIDMVKFWKTRGNWLSTEEGSALRKEENAINLAFLSDGSALYSKSDSIDSKSIKDWPVSERPVGMKQATLKGTSIEFVLNNFTYVLNINQPFVWDTLPKNIYVFDDAGILHGKQFAEDELVSLETAKGNLSEAIPANPNLTLSFLR